MTRLSDHLGVAPPERDLDWLLSALQCAIELEHATLPLYLSAMFSLQVPGYTVYNLIRSAAMEQLVHMATASNILAALGGTPRIKTLNPKFPSNGQPDLHLVLAKLSKKQLENFKRIKLPAIGNLYQAIRGAIRSNADAVRAAMKKGGTSNQVGDDIGFTTITYTDGEDPLPRLYKAIDEIALQCEAHYTKYCEIYYGRRYSKPYGHVPFTRENEHKYFEGFPISQPGVVNLLMVPPDGYEAALKADPNRAAVEAAMTTFDRTYTETMSGLEAMWNEPAGQKFGQAVAAIGELRVLSCFNIMKNQVPQSAIAQLQALYPDQYADLAVYTDLNAPVFYGPRFRNLNAVS